MVTKKEKRGGGGEQAVFVVIHVLHELSGLHAEECDAVSRNVVTRLANQNCVNCLFDVINQSAI